MTDSTEPSPSWDDEDDLMANVAGIVDTAAAEIGKGVWSRIEELERSRLADDSVPLEDRIEAAGNRAMKARELVGEAGGDPRPALYAIWKAAEGTVWRLREGDQPEVAWYLPVAGLEWDFFFLLFACFGLDRDIWGPYMAILEDQLRESADDESREALEDFRALCEG